MWQNTELSSVQALYTLVKEELFFIVQFILECIKLNLAYNDSWLKTESTSESFLIPYRIFLGSLFSGEYCFNVTQFT